MKFEGELDRKKDSSSSKEVVYKIPKKLYGELRMRQNGNEAVVKANLTVDKVEG